MDQLYTQAERITNSTASIRTVAWLRAGLACGARPIEWLNTEWVDKEQTQLRIKNAKVKVSAPGFRREHVEKRNKQSEETAQDPREMEELIFWEASVEYEPPTEHSHRIIPIDSDIDRQAINMHMGFIQELIPQHLDNLEREAAFVTYYETARKTLSRVCRKIWGKKKLYTLYTMRGQFSANMKAAKGSEKTATLMGHSSKNSPSAAFYGKANQAHPKFKTGRASDMPQRQVPGREQEAIRGPIE
ncbi:MAG: hypothetical protein U1C47_09545 [Hydrogenophaga sp.]|nr:hypothetical protein [Hydrogenophaga sp.]